MLLVALPTTGDDLLSSPEIAKLLLPLGCSASIPLQSDSGCGRGLVDEGPGATDVGGLLVPLMLPPAALRLLPGGLVIMAVTEAGMDNPVVWFM